MSGFLRAIQPFIQSKPAASKQTGAASRADAQTPSSDAGPLGLAGMHVQPFVPFRSTFCVESRMVA